MKDRKPKKKVVLELPDIELHEINLSDFEMPKIEDLELPEIEDIELPGCPGRGVLILGLLKNLMPRLNVSQKERDGWIQVFNRMGPAEISRIISLSSDEKRCRRAIENAIKVMEK